MLKTQGFSLVFEHWGFLLFCQIFDGSTRFLRYWVHSFKLGVHSTWFQEYRVPGFESTRDMVSRVWGTWFRRY